MSASKQFLNLSEFILCLPLLGYEMAKGKLRENKYRLKEIKQILHFPETQINESLQKLLDNKPL